MPAWLAIALTATIPVALVVGAVWRAFGFRFAGKKEWEAMTDAMNRFEAARQADHLPDYPPDACWSAGEIFGESEGESGQHGGGGTR